MRKEIFFAVIAGIVVGLIIAFGAWRANSAFKTKQTDEPSAATKNTTTKSNAVTSEGQLGISLVNIEDFDVFTESPIKVNGITKPESVVVISGESQDYTIKSDSDGTFEQEVALEGGVNQLLFSVLDGKGQTTEKKVIVVFSSELAKNLGQ